MSYRIEEEIQLNSKTKYITAVAMLCAIAYIVMAAVKFSVFPAAPFLNYDAKDVIIVIGGFIFGPVTSFIISIIVSIIELLTVSDTGIIGLIMNVLSTCSFACTASFIYKKKKSIIGAFWGLFTGVAAMVVVMVLWNYLITPIYMGYPRAAVAEMLLPVFIPFNLLKGGINMALAMLIYKPVVRALRLANLVPQSSGSSVRGSGRAGYRILAGIIFISCVVIIFVVKRIV